MSKLQIVMRDPNELIPAEYNPRKLSSKQRDDISASLTRFGFADPVIVNKHKDRDNIIIGGHQRTSVAKDLGYKEVPTVEMNLCLAEERELNIRLNKNSGEFDFEALNEFFETDELIEWGFEDDELDFFEPEEEEEVEEDDFDEEPPEEPKTELGRIYQLGDHRLMCGDSTSESDVARLMDGEKADMVLTDPPYFGKMGSGGFANDPKLQASKDKLIDSIRHIYDFHASATFPIIEKFKKEKISIFFFCNKNLVPDYLNWALENKRLFDILTWHKVSTIPANNNTYFPDTEYLIKVKDKGALFKTGIPKEDVSYGKYWLMNSPSEDKGEDHPTVKPQEILKDCLLICSNKKDSVIDLFGGSGSTLIACEQTKRKCRMMELDPKYCDVIVKRYCKLKDIDPDSVFETGVAK